MTENIKNLANEVTGTGKELAETVKSRFQNPLVGSIIISMLLFLWKPILFLILSDKSVEERIAFIEKNYQYGWYFFIPISIAVFYVVAIPYIMWGIGKLLDKAKRGIDNKEKNQKERDIETEIELQEKKKELLSRKNTNETIDNLNAELKNKELEIKNLNEKNKSFQTDLTKRLEKEQAQNDALRKLEAEHKKLKMDFDMLIKENMSLIDNNKALNKEVSRLKENPNFKLKELEGDYFIFLSSELSNFLPEILDLLLSGKDRSQLSEYQLDVVQKYIQGGLIESHFKESGKIYLTEKGRFFYDLYKGNVAVRKGVIRIREDENSLNDDSNYQQK